MTRSEKAFPITNNDTVFQRGLTKREYFAAAAMTGFMSNTKISGTWGELAVIAVRIADALMVELSKPTTEEELERANAAEAARLRNEGLV